LRDPFAAQPKMANIDQSFCRGDDVICRGERRHFSAGAYGPPVAGGILAIPVPECDGRLAAISLAAYLGCVRGLDICDGFAFVLVHRPDTGSCYAARPRKE